MNRSIRQQNVACLALLAVAMGGAGGCADDARSSGAKAAKTSSAISLGDLATTADFPATAALRYGAVTVGVTCSGTLIAPTWVLTAAHCVKNIGSDDPTKWTVHFGSADVTANAGDVYNVVEVHANPEWNPAVIRLGYGDVALLKLDHVVANVTPVALHRTPVPVRTALTLVGFGKSTATPTTEAELSGFLRSGANETISCTDVPFDATRPEILDERSLCFDTEDAPGSCERDSGGPAYLDVGGTLEVAGVVSGARDTDLGACGKYGIYTAVSHEVTYIESVTGPLDGAMAAPATGAADGGAAPPATYAPGGGANTPPPPPSGSAAPAGASDTSTPAATHGCIISATGSSSPAGNASVLGLALGCILVAWRRRTGEVARARA